MSGFDPGFFVAGNFIILLVGLFAIRVIFPQAWVSRLTFTLTGAYLLYLVAPRFVLFFVLFWTVVWLLLKLMQRAEAMKNTKVAGLLTVFAIGIMLSPLLIWKLSPQMFTSAINESFSKALWTLFPQVGFADAIVAIGVPLGLSFTIFRALDLIIKVRLDLLPALDLGRVFYYGFFPPVLAVGPIIEYEEIKMDTRLSRLPDPGDIAVGSMRVLLGCVKVFLLSILLTHAASLLWGDGTGSVLYAWAAILAYGLFFYVNFSGYSDISIGASRLFGLKLKENFDNPYLKTNPSSFWNAWHMSLTRWVNRYVFIPLGGFRENRQYFAIFVTIMVIALWHDISWTLVIFGVYHGIAMVGHRWLESKRAKAGRSLSTNPLIKGFKMFALFVFVCLSMPLLSQPLEALPGIYKTLIPGL